MKLGKLYPKKIKTMNEEKDIKIKELEERIEELENNWKRALADYRNLVKRTEEERIDFVNYTNAAVLKRFIPILDNLELLEKHIDDIGLKMIAKEFKQILNEEGLVEVLPLGMDFDSSTMEAIESIPGEKNKVVEILNKGYLLKDKLVRPARVKVGNGEKE